MAAPADDSTDHDPNGGRPLAAADGPDTAPASESQRRLEALARATFEGVAITEQGRYLDVNPQMAELFGYEPAEMVGMEVGALIAPEDRERVMAGVVAGVEGFVEFRAQRRDGSAFFAEARSRMIRHEGRDIRVSAVRDVTHHRHTEEALRRARDELERKVEERTADLERLNLILQMIIDCNEAIVRATGEQELLEEVCRIIVEVGRYRMAWVGMAEHDEARTVRPVAATGFEDGYLSRIRISWADDELGRGPTGTAIRTAKATVSKDFMSDPELAPWREEALKRGFRSSVALPLLSGGAVIGALTLYSSEPHAFDEGPVRVLLELADDLAFGLTALRTQVERDQARRAAEERASQLRALALQLGRAEQAERRRLARVLHDHLQQLLVAARYGVTAIQSRAGSEALRQTAEQVVGTLDEAVQAARSLTAELSPTVLHEHGLAAGLGWLAGQMRDKHGLTVDVAVDPDAEPATEEVRVFLYEAVRELLFNVVKHAGVDRAEVRTEVMGDGWMEVRVADRGAGLDPERLGATSEGGGGFGLFGIRERLGFLGGQLEIDSAPGQGSRFRLLVPLELRRTADEVAATTAAARTSPDGVPVGPEVAASPGASIRVLLADDHQVVRQGLAALLRLEGDIVVVGEAADGTEAVAMARRLRPDVVIMDVGMPGIDGVEATRILASELPRVRVIGLSLHDDAATAAAMRAAGARAYLNKAGPAEELMAAIRST